MQSVGLHGLDDVMPRRAILFVVVIGGDPIVISCGIRKILFVCLIAFLN